MSDTYIYEDSNETQLTLEPFVSRQVLYANDLNNGSYASGQIQLDTSALSNSGRYCSYSEAYFVVPLVLRLTATSANAQISAIRNLESAFALGLKSNYANFIHSISVEYNNTSVVQLTPYTNFYVNFKMLTTFSKDSLDKYGAILGFYPDGVQSVAYGSQAAYAAEGHGSLNNKDLPQFPADLFSWASVTAAASNSGFFWRQVNTTALNPASAPTSSFTSASLAGTVGLNYFRIGTGADIDCKWWFVTAVIRLKDVADFFDKLPLVKGAFLRFIINTNLPTHNFSIKTSGSALQDISVTQNIITGGSSPILLANGSVNGNGLGATGSSIVGQCIAAGDDTYTFQIAASIVKDTTYNVNHPTLQQTRLYVPVYQMNPINEEAYLSLNKIKLVEYTDIYNYTVDVSCSGTAGSLSGSFSQLLTNGISNIQSIIIMPFVGSASNATGYNGASPVAQIAPYGSPFASEPSTTSPYLAITNFNIQVAGLNVFTMNELYDWQNFKDELSAMNAVNGSQVDGVDSGLIGYSEFEGNYRYYVADLSRRLPAEDAVPKSIQISGTVQGGTVANVQLQCFVVFKKQISIDLETGAKLS